MKKMIKLVSAAIATMALAACSSDDLTSSKSQDFSAARTISATIDSENGGMRSTVSGTSVVWTSGDAFELYSSDESKTDKYTLVGDGGTKSADFGTGTTNVAEGSEGYAIFPSTAVTGLASNVVSMNLPATIDFATQDISGNAFMKTSIPMWASYSSTGLSFKHLGAVMQIDFKDIPDGTTQVILESSQNLSGTFTADLSAAESVLAYSAGGGKTVTINFPSAISSSDNDRLLFVPIPVGTYDLAIKINNGSEKTIKEWKSFTFARKKLYKTSLTYLESAATTESALGTDIQNAFAAASTGDKVVINVTGTIVADANKVEIPVDPSKRVDFELIFANAPTTSSGTPIDFVDKNNSSDASGTARNSLRIVMPGGDTINDMNIEMPYTTVTLESSNGSVVTYSHLTQKTATSTLVVAEKVLISAVADVTGNAGKICVEGGDVTVATSATIAAIEVTAGQLIVPSGATVSALSVITDDESTDDAPVVNIAGTVTTLTLEGEKSEVDLVSGGTIATTPTTGVKAKLTNGNISYFGSVSAALEYEDSPVTEVTLLEDMNETLKAITSDLTLNLNSKVLTVNGSADYNNWSLQRWYPAIYINGTTAINVIINGGTSESAPTTNGKIILDKTWYSGIYSTKGNLTLNHADIEFGENNGFTAANAGIIFWYDAGNLTINGGNLAFGSKPSYGIDFEGAELKVDGTKFTSTSTNGNTVIYFEVGTANIENATIESATLGGIYASGSGSLSSNSTGNVKNCNIKVDATRGNGYSWMSSALACSHGSTLNVEGTECQHIGDKAAAYVFSSGGTINLKSGTYKGSESCLRVDRSTSDLTDNTIGSWIYYSSNCQFDGTNSTNISSGFTGGIEPKSFE